MTNPDDPTNALGVEEARRRLPELLERAAGGEGTHRSPARPAPPPEAFVQPVQHLGPQAAGPRQHAFNPRLLGQGSRIALDGAALVAFLADAKGAGKHLQALMQGIAAGSWIGVVSSISLIRVLEGPLARGDEALAQTGQHPVLSALRL